MSLFSFFKRKNKLNNVGDTPDEYKKVLGFHKSYKTLLNRDQYLARSDYKYLIRLYSET